MSGPVSVSFDRVALEYEQTRFLPATIARRVARRVLRGVGEGAWVLDAGIGTGRLGRALLDAHRRTVGVDISAAMLAEAARLVPGRPPLLQADVTALPFADGAFASSLSVHVLHLVSDWGRALDELVRTLAPGATLYLGFEERQPTELIEALLGEARRAELLPPHPGGLANDLAAGLERRGLKVAWERRADLRWTYDRSAAATLATLERRTYSRLWNIPADDYEALLEKTRRFAVARFGDDLAGIERHTVEMALLAATRRPANSATAR